MRILSIAFIFAFIQVAFAAPLDALVARGIVKPSDDSFYSPKDGYEKLKVGEIINWRKMTNAYGIAIVKERIDSAYQLLVRSEDSFGNPNAIVTTVLIPYNVDNTKILSYQAAVDTPNPDCAPSYALQLGSDPSTWITTQIEQVLSVAGLYEGWIVVIPDFLGPKGAFGVGLQAAHATLNSLKAVVSSNAITGASKDAQIALWGYSGGTQPSLWAAALASTYAPELNIIGAAVGGLLIDLEHVATTAMKFPFAGLVINAINGLANEYPDLLQYVKKIIYPAIETKFFSVTKQCLIPSALSNLFTNWNQLTSLGVNVLQQPVVKNVTSLNNMLNLNAKPTIPLFFYNAKLDEIVPATDADKLFAKWCAQGVSIQYNQDLLSGHITQAIFGSGSAFTWIKDRFKGKSQTGCKKRPTISNALNFESLLGFNNIISSALKTLFFQAVGPQSQLSSQLGSFADLPAKGNDTTEATRTIVQGIATSFAQSDIDAVASGDAILVNAPTSAA
ncbi:LIP-domain-containing protein [Suhomyces tanzawaensis NRRL Y-17324]|uniref:LIP-domain-containing protein n=1 Tax=Suhomyces tanzawaensis NRRL Y-17324 TaxID=984487 RepID=A0A1E4SP91_9ASCO|nr:LIP-domain-containing protein [Suhomyces tanzawaensis NRRL Y-17324]ODV81350.1 LIP-domain-containing protein [Suhomyces tanzawaensis NRRL Y-17324]